MEFCFILLLLRMVVSYFHLLWPALGCRTLYGNALGGLGVSLLAFELYSQYTPGIATLESSLISVYPSSFSKLSKEILQLP